MSFCICFINEWYFCLRGGILLFDNTILWQILLQICLICLNAVFACAEIAIISMNDNKLAKMAADGDKRAVRLARLTSQPARFLATIQVAITLSGFLGSAFAADNFSDHLVGWLVSLGLSVPLRTLDTVAVVVITLILSYFTLVFGELVPKRVAMKKAEALALGMSAMITFIAKLFAPIVWLLTISTDGLLRLLGINPAADEEEVTEEEILMMVDVGSEKGAIDNTEKTMIRNVFRFDDLTAGEIAVHRTAIDLLWLDDQMDQWETVIHQSRHSLYPVCEESIDNVVGVLNAKDYFRLADHSRASVMRSAIKPAYFVPESVRADVLFRNMRLNHSYFAVVVDEYGGVQGIVTMNDLVSQLVGVLDDGPDVQDSWMEIKQLPEGVWQIGGGAPLD
ncbi:MAG: hemolysin family protein, partial [Clostridiales bacterium]